MGPEAVTEQRGSFEASDKEKSNGPEGDIEKAKASGAEPSPGIAQLVDHGPGPVSLEFWRASQWLELIQGSEGPGGHLQPDTNRRELARAFECVNTGFPKILKQNVPKCLMRLF